jgi:hypothetical protein
VLHSIQNNAIRQIRRPWNSSFSANVFNQQLCNNNRSYMCKQLVSGSLLLSGQTTMDHYQMSSPWSTWSQILRSGNKNVSLTLVIYKPLYVVKKFYWVLLLQDRIYQLHISRFLEG